MKSRLLRRKSRTRLLSRNKSRSKSSKSRSNSGKRRLQGGVNNAELVKIVRAEFPQYEFVESKDGKNHIKLTSNEGWSISLGSQHRGDKFGSEVHLALIRKDVRRFHEAHIRRLEERSSSSSPTGSADSRSRASTSALRAPARRG